MEGYHDGDLEYSVVESLIEEIIDKYDLRAYFYLESNKYDNTASISMLSESTNDLKEYDETDEIKINALINLVADLLDGKIDDERNAIITLIYDSVYEGIHIDDEAYDEEEEAE